MTITKNEFKELYSLYAEAMDKFTEVSTYINEGLADDLIFPMFHWVEEKLGLYPDIIGNLWSNEATEEEIAAVYEEHLKNRLLLLEEKMCEMEESLNA